MLTDLLLATGRIAYVMRSDGMYYSLQQQMIDKHF